MTRTPSARERFERFVYPEPNTGCHLFAGASSLGYGSFRLAGKTVAAHRFAWEQQHGPLPPGSNLLHRCDTRCCVNPDHLYLGTLQENASDMARKGRGRKSRSGLPFGAQRQLRGGGFQARVTVGKTTHRLGTYATPEEASRVAVSKKNELLGKGVTKMKSVGPDQVAKPNSLKIEGVDMLSKPLPAPAKAGVNAVIKK